MVGEAEKEREREEESVSARVQVDRKKGQVSRGNKKGKKMTGYRRRGEGGRKLKEKTRRTGGEQRKYEWDK